MLGHLTQELAASPGGTRKARHRGPMVEVVLLLSRQACALWGFLRQLVQRIVPRVNRYLHALLLGPEG